MKITKRPYLFFIILALQASFSFAATDNKKVQQLLAQEKSPAGVVFEIAVADPDALKWAVPKIQQYARQLRQKFPKLEMAVVTHGREQFALQKDNTDEYENVHKQVAQLAKSDDIPVHICQTFAGWNGVDPEDFPEYVTVSATGPQQVNDYISLGYTLIIISEN